LGKRDIISIRGYLIHLTHYDPEWCKRKSREQPLDLELGLEVIDALAGIGFNLLIIDCADGVRYKSHPELARRYSAPVSWLKKLAKRAQSQHIEIVPKLNFSHSSFHRHNYWFRPYNALFDNDEYWRLAFEIIDELIEVCRPKRYFHVGMDEDHDRTYAQYIEAVSKLRKGLKQRGLRTLIWNDSSQIENPLVDARKSLEAQKQIPKDIVQIVWDYEQVRPNIVRRLADDGFEVWVAPGQDPKQVLQWKKTILKYGGKGMVMTTWSPCRRSNRSKMLKFIKNAGPIYCSPE